MSLQGYNFEEEAIRDMVEAFHIPAEMVTGNSRRVVCGTDTEEWPCTVLLRLRKWRQETGKLD
jgi:hypothetical protein